MSLEKLKSLIEKGESEILEFKESTAELKKGLQALCAFLNTGGGTVLFGVNNKGVALGQDVSDNTLNKINQEINKIEPSVQFTIACYKLDFSKRQVVAISTEPGVEIPYTYDGKSYHRMQKSTFVMPQEKYKQLLLEQVYAIRPWEKFPAIDVAVSDLDREEIIYAVKDGIEKGRIDPQLETSDVIEALEGLQLMDKGIINAAAVLFLAKASIHYSQCQVQLARFLGNEKDEFLDSRRVQGHAFKLFRESISFIHQHTSVASTFSNDSFIRKDIPAYPPLAIREAVINAIVHRDYTQTGGISIAIFDNYLEIWSEGALPKNITVDELWKRHSSKPRNRLIADIFYTRGLLEEWGRGTLKIIEECQRNGNKPPEFIEQSGSFCVRIWAKQPFISSIKQESKEEVSLILSDRQQEIIHILQKAGKSLKSNEIREKLSQPTAERTFRDDLAVLKRQGLIASRGRGAHASWFIVSKSL